jgi:site-specific DNA recombinase
MGDRARSWCLRRLDPDPATARHVRWMFEQRLAGRSMAGIARELTERGVPCPSDVDPGRNSHRGGGAWTLRTVSVILINPRYTGRQVWNRQPGEHAGGRAGGRSSPAEWTISAQVAHPALVSEAEFVAAQRVRAARPTEDGQARRYLFPVLSSAGCVDEGWTRTGCTVGPGAVAGTVTPALTHGGWTSRRTSTSVRTPCCANLRR